MIWLVYFCILFAFDWRKKKIHTVQLYNRLIYIAIDYLFEPLYFSFLYNYY